MRCGLLIGLLAVLVAAVAAVAVTSRGSRHSAAGVATPKRSEVKAVYADWTRDGRFNKPHSCAAVREAINEVKSRFFVAQSFTRRAEDTYCEGPVRRHYAASD